MRKEILERYELSGANEIIINIATDRIEDLYNNFDKKSPFLKKDLSEDFVTYLIDCVSEIEKEKFLIQISLDTPAETSSVSRVQNSIHQFFLYMKELETKQMRAKAKTSMILLGIGLFLAFISLFLSNTTAQNGSLVLGVLTEGLTVAAWVSLWEAIATFLIRWMPYRKKISLYEQIAHAKVTVTTEHQK
jgi:hypothetical protein